MWNIHRRPLLFRISRTRSKSRSLVLGHDARARGLLGFNYLRANRARETGETMTDCQRDCRISDWRYLSSRVDFSPVLSSNGDKK